MFSMVANSNSYEEGESITDYNKRCFSHAKLLVGLFCPEGETDVCLSAASTVTSPFTYDVEGLEYEACEEEENASALDILYNIAFGDAVSSPVVQQSVTATATAAEHQEIVTTTEDSADLELFQDSDGTSNHPSEEYSGVESGMESDSTVTGLSNNGSVGDEDNIFSSRTRDMHHADVQTPLSLTISSTAFEKQVSSPRVDSGLELNLSQKLTLTPINDDSKSEEAESEISVDIAAGDVEMNEHTVSIEDSTGESVQPESQTITSHESKGIQSNMQAINDSTNANEVQAGTIEHESDDEQEVIVVDDSESELESVEQNHYKKAACFDVEEVVCIVNSMEDEGHTQIQVVDMSTTSDLEHTPEKGHDMPDETETKEIVLRAARSGSDTNLDIDCMTEGKIEEIGVDIPAEEEKQAVYVVKTEAEVEVRKTNVGADDQEAVLSDEITQVSEIARIAGESVVESEKVTTCEIKPQTISTNNEMLNYTKTSGSIEALEFNVTETIKSFNAPPPSVKRESLISAFKSNPELDFIADCLQRISRNDSSLTEFDIKNCRSFSDINAASLSSALETNTYILQINLSNVGLTTQSAMLLGKAIAKNETLQVLNLESNIIGTQGVPLL
jgi:hypothetical protein